MARQKNENVQSALALLVLQTLSARGPLHGYGIAQQIQAWSADLLRVEEGSLYPALHRMAQDGLIKGKWGVTDRNREAVFYAITAAGRKRLLAEQQSWERLVEGVRRVLVQT